MTDGPCDICRNDHPCPAEEQRCAHYRAVWTEWAADPTNRILWARVNAALDGLEAHLSR